MTKHHMWSRAARVLAVTILILTVHDARAASTLEDLRFTIQKGDGARVTVSTVEEQSPGSEFQVTVDYTVAEVTEMGEYLIETRLSGAGKTGVASPPGFDDMMATLFPPVVIRSATNCQPVCVVDWPRVSSEMTIKLKAVKPNNIAASLVVLTLLPYATGEENFLGLLRPIAEIQPANWTVKGEFAIAQVRRTLGTVGMSGEMRIRLHEGKAAEGLPNDAEHVIVTYSTVYDTSSFIDQTPLLKQLQELTGKLSVSTTVTGQAALNTKTGWLSQLRETLTVEVSTGDGKQPKQRTVRSVVTQTRKQ